MAAADPVKVADNTGINVAQLIQSLPVLFGGGKTTKSGGGSTSVASGGDLGPLNQIFANQLPGTTPEGMQQLIQAIFSKGSEQVPVLSAALANSVGARTRGNSSLTLALNDLQARLTREGVTALSENQTRAAGTAAAIAANSGRTTTTSQQDSTINQEGLLGGQKAAKKTAAATMLGGILANQLFKKGGLGGIFEKTGGGGSPKDPIDVSATPQETIYSHGNELGLGGGDLPVGANPGDAMGPALETGISSAGPALMADTSGFDTSGFSAGDFGFDPSSISDAIGTVGTEFAGATGDLGAFGGVLDAFDFADGGMVERRGQTYMGPAPVRTGTMALNQTAAAAAPVPVNSNTISRAVAPTRTGTVTGRPADQNQTDESGGGGAAASGGISGFGNTAVTTNIGDMGYGALLLGSMMLNPGIGLLTAANMVSQVATGKTGWGHLTSALAAALGIGQSAQSGKGADAAMAAFDSDDASMGAAMAAALTAAADVTAAEGDASAGLGFGDTTGEGFGAEGGLGSAIGGDGLGGFGAGEGAVGDGGFGGEGGGATGGDGAGGTGGEGGGGDGGAGGGDGGSGEADGGYISKAGSAGPYADDKQINVSGGEYVISADVVNALGTRTLDTLMRAFHTPVKGGTKTPDGSLVPGKQMGGR